MTLVANFFLFEGSRFKRLVLAVAKLTKHIKGPWTLALLRLLLTLMSS